MRGVVTPLVQERSLRYSLVMTLVPTVLLLAAAQVSAAAAPLPSELHNYKDWVVTCDNTLRCQATPLVPEEAENARTSDEQRDPWERFGFLTIERDAGGNAPVRMTIGDFEGVPASLMINDGTIAARLTRAEEGEWTVDPEDRNAFLDQLYSGTLLVKDAGGQTIAEIALDGLWDALVYMDERQGRIGTPTALRRRGRRPAALVPAAPPTPVVQAAPRTSERPLAIPAARMAQARREMGCTTEDVGAVASTDAPVHALGNGRTLIMMACGAGAYNYQAYPLIARQDGRTIRIEPARFDVARELSESEPDPKGYYVTNASFDDATLSISEFAKGRGLGDCGLAARYVWDGQMFRLADQQEMIECRGSREFLTTWRADVR